MPHGPTAVIPGCNPRVSGGFHVNQRIYGFRRVAALAVMAPIAKTLLKNYIADAYDRFAQYLRMSRNGGVGWQRELYLWRGPAPSPLADERISASVMRTYFRNEEAVIRLFQPQPRHTVTHGMDHLAVHRFSNTGQWSRYPAGADLETLAGDPWAAGWRRSGSCLRRVFTGRSAGSGAGRHQCGCSRCPAIRRNDQLFDCLSAARSSRSRQRAMAVRPRNGEPAASSAMLRQRSRN